MEEVAVRREAYYEDVVRNFISRPELRQRFLEMVVSKLGAIKAHTLDRLQYGPILGGHGLTDGPEISPKFTKASLASYPLHAIIDEIHFASPPSRHENALDTIVYLGLEITLAPLIEFGVVASLRRGYHNFFVAYEAGAISGGLDRVGNSYFEPGTLLKNISSQARAPYEHNEETEIVTEILSEMAERK